MQRGPVWPETCVYQGTVVHKRLRPKPHALSYRVFWLLLDLDELDAAASANRLFSLNRWNAVSFHEADHGDKTVMSDPPACPGYLAAHARATFSAHGLEQATERIYLLSYPRILNYTFNPISVYFGYDRHGRLTGAIYEVNNTFGERHSYVAHIAAAGAGDEAAKIVHAHRCEKRLYVSPFTAMAGSYSFRLTAPLANLTLGVLLRDAGGPLLKTHLTARRRPLQDATLARLLVTCPLMTLKVTAGIHFEAAKLWLKGVPLTDKPRGLRYSASTIEPSTAPSSDAIFKALHHASSAGSHAEQKVTL